MESLNINSRQRLKGQNIFCSVCATTCSAQTKEKKTTWKCKSKGVHLTNCPNPISQKFASYLYNPFTKKSDIMVLHDTREFSDFRTEHNKLLDLEYEIKSLYKAGKTQQAQMMINAIRGIEEEQEELEHKEEDREIVISPDTYLETAMYIYRDFLKGKKGEEYEKRPGAKAIDNYLRSLERFQASLVANNFNPELLSLSKIAKKHLLPYIREIKSSSWANKTQNDYLNNVSIFFGWCTNRGAGKICNHLDHVKRGKTTGNTASASLHDFKKMMALVVPENGVGVEKWFNHKKGKEESKKKNYYRPWIPDGLWLSLLIGGRGDEIADFDWTEVHQMEIDTGETVYWIELFDWKYFRKEAVKKYNFVPVFGQTLEILLRLGLKEFIGQKRYVIEPEIENRSRIKRRLSEAFRWFWKDQAGLDDKVTYSSLRTTYITLTSGIAGKDYELVQKHTKADVTRKHYTDKKIKVAGLFGQEFQDVKMNELIEERKKLQEK